MNQKVILVTGATSGIGMETAKLLVDQGHIVYGAGRRKDKLKELEELGVHSLLLDITNEESMENAVKTIISKEKKIDILINNAGYGSFGAIEDVQIEEAKRQFEVNIFGLARLTQLVLPYMRKQKSGRIINITSMGGKFTTFMGAWYHATKYALESFSDALRMEVKPFNIKVIIIEPGAIKTDWGFIAADNLEQSSTIEDYKEASKNMAKGIRKQYSSKYLTEPKVIAKAIGKAVNNNSPKTRYLIGFGAKPLVFLHAILPDKTFDYLIQKVW